MTEGIPATYHQKEAKVMYVEEPEKQNKQRMESQF
ncbi:Hypothetical protein TPAS_2495 [Trichococcus pasteurii]|uniref:Uncharacterized protein n=1 Tax=Trichococcus pasteurii TaxID=43064 RepID=A0A1W1IIA5_9LACT|nr:Hypothetical protein TPAS_2495 [Trichococcus pasteurii]SSB93669.1 Hypothetical protein TPAS_2495 [Trichococcus pasteurii]